MPHRSVTLLWPSSDGRGLVERPFEIFATKSRVDQATQIVGALLGPPPDSGVSSPFPPGTALRAVFLHAQGIATVNLSREVVEKSPGGSAWEIAAVNSLAGSLTRGLPPVDRVQILIEGQPVDSLGHLDLRGPVRFDPTALAP